jgi:uncharacterized YkwD family protein
LISKKLWVNGLASVMILGLVGCNNNNDTAFDNERDNRQRILNERNNDMNSRAIFNRDNRDIRDQNLDPNDRRNRYEFYDQNRNGRNDGRFDGLEISSNSTNTPSNKFPHTQAVLIQEAKFKYVKVGNPQGQNRDQRRINQRGPSQIVVPQLNIAVPTPQQRNQGQTVAPQPTAPAPVPAQTPKPATPAPTPKPAAPAPAPTTQAPATQGISQAAARVIELTNVQRRQNGLPDLKADTQLSSVAQKKSVDMKQNNYFSHTSPTYGSPFDMMRDFGVTYKTAGENIAQGQQTPEQVVDAWMKSQGHRENILSPKYTHIGVGYESGGHHWTQMFIGK